jgi:hypothetical protein
VERYNDLTMPDSSYMREFSFVAGVIGGSIALIRVRRPADQCEFVDYFAGCISGAFSKTLLAPFDRASRVLKVQDDHPDTIAYSDGTPNHKRIDAFPIASVFGVHALWSRQGFFALWRGNAINVLQYFPRQAFYLAHSGDIQWLVAKTMMWTVTAIGCRFEKPSDAYWVGPAKDLLVSGTMAAFTLILIQPLEVARTLLLADARFTGLADCICEIASGPEGLSALYSGYSAALLGVVARHAVYRASDAFIISISPSRSKESQLEAGGFFSHLARHTRLAPLVASLATYPLDAIGRKLQLQLLSPRRCLPYSGFVDCACRTVAEGGVVALWSGAWVEVSDWAVLSVFGMAAYSTMKEALYSSTADAKAAKQKQRIYDEYIASMQAGPKDNCGFLIVLPAAGEPLAASILKSYGVTVTETGTIKPEGAAAAAVAAGVTSAATVETGPVAGTGGEDETKERREGQYEAGQDHGAYCVFEWPSAALQWSAAVSSTGLAGMFSRNGIEVYIPASAFEALAARIRWIGRTVEEDSYGRVLLIAGIPKVRILDWVTNPSVFVLLDGKTCSKPLFEVLRGGDAATCTGFLTVQASV